MNSKSSQVYATMAVMVLAPFFFGSVDLFWVSLWTITLSISALGGFFVPLKKGQARILLAVVSLCCVYGVVAIIQIVPHAFDRLNDVIWQRSSELLATPAQPRISSRAEIPPLAIGHVLLFAVALINGLCIGTSRRDSERIVRCAQYFILSFAVYGFAALLFTPNLLIWANKTAYLGYLTATFVNHNTAATLLGAGGILWFCSAFSTAQSVNFDSVRTILLSRSSEGLAVKLIIRSGAALLCFAALLQTGSRGGLICSFAGLLGAMVLMMLAKNRSLKPSYAFSVLAAALLVCFLVLARTGRIASQGLIDEGRWSVYQLAFEAIKRRPLFGSGAGTFADQFPAFRSSNLPSWGVWDFAHSSILEIAVEMGVPVAMLIAACAFVSVYVLARAAVTADGYDQRMLAAIAGIAILTYLHSLIDFSLQIPGYLIVFGILLGCGLSRATSDQVNPIDSRIPRAEAKRSHRI